MATIEELKDKWAIDCIINDDDLSASAAKTAQLHSFYLNELINAKLKYTKTQLDMNKVRALKGKYFRGELTTLELKELGWQQWQLRTLKSDIEGLIDADEEVQKYIGRIEYIKAMMYFLESVLGQIKSRTFDVRAMMDWAKFRAGS